MFHDLHGKRILVTGGASGIGLATATRFAEEGARVFIIDYDARALDTVLSRDARLCGACADVSDGAQVASAFAKMDEVMGGIDVLVSNAGISVRHPFFDITYEQWNKVMGVNLGGMFLCAQEAIRRMKPHRRGVVLFTSSTNGLFGHPLYADYNASKAGVILLAKTLALEFAPWLRVNAVCPGYVLTPMQEAEYTPDMLREVNEGIPLGRHATPEEVAGFFAFLASDGAAYITGQALCIDGGEIAGQFLKGLDGGDAE